ncbi:hypothetical protein F5887DRAFT_981395, partial [Amanita rubescens]
MLRSRAAHSIVSVSRHSRRTNTQWKRSNSYEAARTEDTNDESEHHLLARLVYRNEESALIRSVEFPESMRDVLAIVRAVEEKYGSIKEFKCFRDAEVSTNYQAIIRVTFRHRQSPTRLPDKEELRITLPPALPCDQPGGIGLADLEGYLEASENPITASSNAPSAPKLEGVMTKVFEESERDAAGKSVGRVLTCTIQPTNFSFYTPSHSTFFWLARTEREAVARQLLNWGGFHEFPPLEKNRPLPEEDFFRDSKIEHFRMRHCLRRSSQQSGVPNPYEYSPKESSKPEWEPLSEPMPAVAEFNPLAPFREEKQKVEQAPSDPTISSANSTEATSIPNVMPLAKGTKSPLPTASASTTSTSQIDKKELAAQLSVARLLAQQVTQELANKHAKQKQTPKVEEAPSVSKEDSLFEESAHPREKYSSIDAKANLPLEQDTAESTKVPESKPTEQQTDESQNGGVLKKLKGAWGS